LGEIINPLKYAVNNVTSPTAVQNSVYS